MKPLDCFRPPSRARAWGDRVFLLGLAGWGFYRFAKALQRSRRASPSIRLRAVFGYRLPVMSAAGFSAGYLASRYLNPGRGAAFHALHGRLTAAWSSLLIAADAAMDEKQLDPADSRELLRRSFLHMLLPALSAHDAAGAASGLHVAYEETFRERRVAAVLPSPYEPAAGFRLENLSLFWSREFGEALRLVQERLRDCGGRDTAIRASVEQFQGDLLALARAQLLSLRQTDVTPEHDWRWYRDNLLSSKFDHILFAPFSLCLPLDKDVHARDEIREGLSLVNGLFCHRQAVDDLLDIEDDVARRISATPACLLISLGNLAEGVLRRWGASDAAPRDEADRVMLERIHASGLLENEFAAWRRQTAVQASVAATTGATAASATAALMARRALGLAPDTGTVDLTEAARRALDLRDGYLDAMRSGDRDEALRCLVASRVADRIIETIEDPERRRQFEGRLAPFNRPGLVEMLRLFHGRCLRSYLRAKTRLRRLDRRYGRALPDQIERRRLVDAATARVRQRSPLVHGLYRFLLRHPQKEHLLFAYAYFGWLDDRIDDPHASAGEKLALIAREKDLFAALCRGEEPPHLCHDEETFLRRLVEFDRRQRESLRPWMSDLLASLEFDAMRFARRHPPPAAELHEHAEKEVTACLAILHCFVDQNSGPGPGGRAYEAVAGKIAHNLRDFREDLTHGIINISQEDVSRYRIDLHRGAFDGYTDWVRAQVQLAWNFFARAAAHPRRHLSPRYRLAVAILSAKYKWILCDIEARGFRLGGATGPQSSRVSGDLWRRLRTVRAMLSAYVNPKSRLRNHPRPCERFRPSGAAP